MTEDKKLKCYLCDSTEVINEHCTQCNQPYCELDSNKLNPQFYCADCHKDVVIEEKVYTRKDIDYHPKSDTITETSRSCKQIVFSGKDWIAHSKKLSELTEEEQKFHLNYHRACAYHLEQEITAGAVRKQKLVLNRGTEINVTQQTTVKTRRVARVKGPADLLNAMAKVNLTDSQKQQLMNLLGFNQPDSGKVQ